MRVLSKADAIMSLRPESQWVLRDDDLQWLDATQTKPTKAAITAEVTRLQAEYDANQYQRDRKAKYDALNQLELISDDAINGTTTHKDAILAIKAEIPKPGETI
jgi:hypothetical protein